jgi:aminoglycoside 6-adenylyltransferase
MLDQVAREQLMKMLAWHIGVETQFLINPGKFGKYFDKRLQPELWEMLVKTYSDASYDNTWESLFIMCHLFRLTALHVAEHFNLDYPLGEDKRVSAHLQHVRILPRNSKQIY